MEERMLWNLTPVFPLWYFSNRGLFASLDTAVEVSCWGKCGFLDRRYGLNVAQDFLYFRVLRSYKTGIVRVLSSNAKCRYFLIEQKNVTPFEEK